MERATLGFRVAVVGKMPGKYGLVIFENVFGRGGQGSILIIYGYIRIHMIYAEPLAPLGSPGNPLRNPKKGT